MTCSCYRIKNWDDIYENNRTRELKDLKWFPCPLKLSGDGYTLIMDEPDGASIFGAWIATAELAATCEPRGTLVRSAGIPHDAASIARQTRMPLNIIEKMLSFCVTSCKWLELIDIQNGATIPQASATIPQEGALKGREGKEEKNIANELFDTFWKAYPKKVSKGDAIKAWGKRKDKKSTLELILKSLAWQTKTNEWIKEEGQYIPYPATYLNHQRWLDEKGKPTTGGAKFVC